jgi:hypothetical protein
LWPEADIGPTGAQLQLGTAQRLHDPYELREVLAISKGGFDKQSDGLAFPNGHFFGRFTTWTIAPDRPQGAKIAIDPYGRDMELVLITTKYERGTYKYGQFCSRR